MDKDKIQKLYDQATRLNFKNDPDCNKLCGFIQQALEEEPKGSVKWLDIEYVESHYIPIVDSAKKREKNDAYNTARDWFTFELKGMLVKEI